ncbi:MAG: hypothetical protein ACHQEB_00995 [Chitinophagales bacterium]
MLSLKKIIFLSFAFTAFTSASAQVDTLHAKDSVIRVEDCYEHFFQQSEKITAPGKTILVMKNKKVITLAAFLKSNDPDNVMGIEAHQGLADLDNDGKKELVLFNYTGGAHCCDEFYIFRKIAPDKYQYAAKTYAGDVCITEKNELVYNFYQQFGYFFTCFACSYPDTTDAGPEPIQGVILKYNKGKLTVIPGDKELRNTITDNLGKLSEQPYQKLADEADQDNGLRKEFALNLAVFHYCFGKNLVETKKLFDKYYRFPDAKKVWAAFLMQLKTLGINNDF